MKTPLTAEEMAAEGAEAYRRIAHVWRVLEKGEHWADVRDDRDLDFGSKDWKLRHRGVQAWFQREVPYSDRQTVWKVCRGTTRLGRRAEARLRQLEREAGLA